MLDKAEIAAKVGQAEDKAEMIAILALTNKVDKSEIRNIAVDGHTLIQWNDEKVQELYDAGYSDRQLSNAFGFNEHVILQWRAKKRLGPKRNEIHLSHRTAKIDSEKAMELYKQGLSDTAIGKEFGAKATSVLQWRRKHGLPSNYMPAPKAKAEKAAPAEGQQTAAGEAHEKPAVPETPKSEPVPTLGTGESVQPPQTVSEPVGADEKTGAEDAPVNGAAPENHQKISAASIIVMEAENMEPGDHNSLVEGEPDTEREFVIPIPQIPRMAQGGMVGPDANKEDPEESEGDAESEDDSRPVPAKGIACACCHERLPEVGPMRIELLAVIGTEKYPVCPACGLALFWASRKLQEQAAQRIEAPAPAEAKP